MKFSFSSQNGKFSFSATSENSREVYEIVDEIFSEQELNFDRLSFSSKHFCFETKE